MFYRTKPLDYHYATQIPLSARRLNEIALSSSRFIRNENIKNQFLNEVRKYSQYYLDMHRGSSYFDLKQEALSALNSEAENLIRQENLLKYNFYKQYATIEIRKKLDFSDYILKGIGIIVGGTQISAGITIMSAGDASVAASVVGNIAGAALIVHGIGNIQENLGAIIENDANFKGYLRYEYAAEFLGYSRKTGSLVYGGVDLMLSGYGLFRSTLKPEAWRLFHYINQDYVRSYQLMHGYALGFEIMADGITIKSAYDIYNDPNYNKT
ncbi:DUF4225 domain-containing protein [Xenorhabdus sp. PR6a]|uniref:DUF4225 domain-containing protein n=1 Tax=Xenorhabdus sp. PR6a TaxID=3025877 RepID=UPI002358447D|nr:DUF4225 domain-containing protein [Xenorhabdus sp. PR6a]MDC9581743.1 DUF4225 domain-containing protein [Xenorhabdus sp. PR6a]